MGYKQYWKSEFQGTLSSFAKSNGMIGWQEVSEELEGDDVPIREFVYRISLRNPSASIIVFSSVDKATERTRENGTDAVRIIYEWKTKNGLIYSKIAKRNREETLFQNLEDSIVEAASNCFNLGNYSWGELSVAMS